MNEFDQDIIVEEQAAAPSVETSKAGSLWLSPEFLVAAPLVALAAGNALYFYRFKQGMVFFQLIKEAYFFNTILLPLLFISLGIAALIAVKDWRRQRTLLGAACFNVALALTLGGLRVWCTNIEPHWLAVREQSITLSQIDAPLRILHFSDTQSTKVGAYEEQAFRSIVELKPDLILHTGDFLQPMGETSWQSESERLARLFATLDPPLGVYGVYGDVDQKPSGLDINGSRLKLLDNTAVEIPWRNRHIRIYGLSSQGSRKPNEQAVEQWLRQAAPNDINLLMGHAPDYIRSLKDLSIDLCLAGHTHGGQIRIPFYGPVVTFSRVPRELALGLHQVGNTRLNVSGGVGSEHSCDVPSIRLNCPTEMSLIEFRPDKSRL